MPSWDVGQVHLREILEVYTWAFGGNKMCLLGQEDVPFEDLDFFNEGGLFKGAINHLRITTIVIRRYFEEE